jgi:hypothetical protein
MVYFPIRLSPSIKIAFFPLLFSFQSSSLSYIFLFKIMLFPQFLIMRICKKYLPIPQKLAILMREHLSCIGGRQTGTRSLPDGISILECKTQAGREKWHRQTRVKSEIFV